jgi:hypothetical protein
MVRFSLSNKILNRFYIFSLEKYLVPFIFFLGVVYYYRNEGVRDLGYYEEAGKVLASKGNPYEDLAWRSGPIGTIFLHFVFGAFPKEVKIVLFQFISVLGFILLIKPFLKGLNLLQLNFLFTAVIASAPVRETISAKQLTGLMAMAIALSITPILMRENLSGKQSIFASLVLAIALDLKPHTLIPLLIMMIFYKSGLRVILISATSLAFMHVAISVYCKKFLLLEWFDNIKDLGNSLGKDGESVSLWKILVLADVSENLVVYISAIFQIVILVFGLYLLKRKLILFAVLLVLISQSLGSYVHIYDFALVSTLMLCLITKKYLSYVHLLFLMFVIVPLEYLKVFNLILIVVLSVFFCSIKAKGKKSYILCLAALLTYYGVQNLNEVFSLGYKDQLSLRMFEINSLMFLIVYNSVIEKIFIKKLEIT